MSERFKKFRDFLRNATIGASVAENPAVMTAAGWHQDKDGNWEQEQTDADKQLADNLASIGNAGLIGLTLGAGAADALYTPAKTGMELMGHVFTPSSYVRLFSQLPRVGQNVSKVMPFAKTIADPLVHSGFMAGAIDRLGRKVINGTAGSEPLQDALDATMLVGPAAAVTSKGLNYLNYFKPFAAKYPEQFYGKVKYYGPTMGKTTAAKRNAQLVDFDDVIREKIAESHNLFQADVYRGGKEGNWYTTDKKYASQYGPVSKYKIEAKKVYDPEEPLIFHQKPSKLTEAERLGIPKGERNNIQFRPHDYGNLRFIKNYSGIPIMENGKIRISPQENLLANVTTDVPFRLHKDYPKMPGSEYLIIDPKGLRGKTPLSIEPSDTFFPNDDLLIDPQYVRVLTGNKKIIPELEKLGLQVETSPELQNIYEQIMASQEKPSLLSKTDFGSQNGIDLYREAIDKYITDVIGRPSLKDYIHLEKLTGLNAGVEQNIGQFNKYFQLFDDVNNGKITLQNIPDPAWVFPNKRELNISHFIPRHGVSSYQSRLKIPYKEVYYDPTSYIESDITAQLNGMSSHPTYERYGEQGIQAIKEYILKHHLRPLRQQGGKLNYAKFYK